VGESENENRALYDRGVEALSRLLGRQIYSYMCPICLRHFEKLNDLHREHVPPESIGGKVLCLTCEKCNCGAGHSIDAQVHKESRSRSFIAIEGQERPAKINVGDLAVNIDVTRTKDTMKIRVLGDKANSPKTIEGLRSILPGMIQSKSSIRLSDRISYSRSSADIGYLKSAYLAAFAKFGYSYILRPALDRVRLQIQDPTRVVLKTVRVYVGESDAYEEAFFWVRAPISCLAARIRDSVVCLPLPNGDDLFYETLGEMRKGGHALTLQIAGTTEWPDRFELAIDFAEND
jgi:hypothetical protein